MISNVTNVVSSANQTSDQNIDNLRVVSNVLSQSAQVIQTNMNVSIEVINDVSFHCLTKHAKFHVKNLLLFLIKATTGAVAILDSVEDWPEDIVEQQSNQ